jgi:site-specific DNA-methyltransferase (adenine-specific)
LEVEVIWPQDFINKIICGDCLEVMKLMSKDSVDAIITDPPYGLEFMGKEWDKLDKPGRDRSKAIQASSFGKIMDSNCDSPRIIRSHRRKCNVCGGYSGGPFQLCSCDNPEWIPSPYPMAMQFWHTQWLTEAYRVLKPGASMLVMGGTRTFHRLACAIEDSGFIIKDCLMWIYGSGFPKAQDLGKMIDKRANAKREVIGKSDRHGGGIPGNASSYEISSEIPDITIPVTNLAKYWDGFKVGGIKPAYEPIIWAVKPPEGSCVDNVLKWGVGAVNVDECRIDYVDEIDKSEATPQGKCTSGNIVGGGIESERNEFKRPEQKGRFPANVILDEESARMLDEQSGNLLSGKPAGFKTGGQANCYGKFSGGIPVTGIGDSGGASRFFYCAKASRSERGKDNKHPTVKPISLFMWLIKLITREEQIILDPFFGSGTTGIAANQSNRKWIGIEKEKDYCKIAEERLAQGVL